MLRIWKFLALAIQLSLTFSLVWLGGCTTITGQDKVVLLPFHIENMKTLVLSDQQRKLLNDGFEVAIEEPVYQAVNNENVARQLQPHHKRRCYSFKCQREVAEIVQSPLIGLGRISQYGGYTVLSVTITDTSRGTRTVKHRYCKDCRFLDWVYEIRSMESDYMWLPVGRVLPGLVVSEQGFLVRMPARKSEMAEIRQKSEDWPRTNEEIQRVVDRSVLRFLPIYRQVLRDDPETVGKVVFKAVIEADGVVSSVDVISSELGNALLEKKLAAEIELMDFYVRNAQCSVTIPIYFYPY